MRYANVGSLKKEFGENVGARARIIFVVFGLKRGKQRKKPIDRK